MVEKEMGVIGSDGIIGIVNQTTENFSSVLSILHKDIKINAKHKKTNAFGSLFWEGNDPDKVTLSDISIINKINIGDTIVTGGMSSYFPEGIPIGKIVEFKNNGRYYSINVKLINNMTNLNNVYFLKIKINLRLSPFTNKNESILPKNIFAFLFFDFFTTSNF